MSEHDALARAERRSDRLLTRVVGRIWRELRSYRSRRLVPISSPVAAHDDGEALTMEALCARLGRAQAVGAFETTERLAMKLLTLVDAASSLPSDGVVPLLEALLLLGQRARAAEVARQHSSELTRTDRGVTLLELLDMAPSSVRLPSGRPNCLRLSRRIEVGELDAVGLAGALAPLGWRGYHEPDVFLLFYNASRRSDPACAARFLARYFNASGVSRCRATATPEANESPMARLRFEPLPMVTGPLVSILISARNAADSVRKAVDSLLAQSYQSLEILIADDASDDDTPAVLKGSYAGHPRVRLFRSTKNQGTYNVKNGLAQRASGEFLAFHDADDIALPFRIALQLRSIVRGPVVASVGNGIRIRPSGEVVFFKDQRATRLSPVSLLVERRAFDAVGGFRGAWVGADQELYASLRTRNGSGSVTRLRSPLLLSSWSAGSATRTFGTESLEDGYRSPSRRVYSELIFTKYAARRPLSDFEIEQRLRETGNYAEPAELVEL